MAAQRSHVGPVARAIAGVALVLVMALPAHAVLQPHTPLPPGAPRPDHHAGRTVLTRHHSQQITPVHPQPPSHPGGSVSLHPSHQVAVPRS
jgi:hypothetical protein